MGEVASAMVSAAAVGPGTVAELAARACVGYDAARYTASRLVSSGALVALSAGRPAVLGAPEAAQAQQWSPARLGVALEQLRSFWEGDAPARAAAALDGRSAHPPADDA